MTIKPWVSDGGEESISRVTTFNEKDINLQIMSRQYQYCILIGNGAAQYTFLINSLTKGVCFFRRKTVVSIQVERIFA